MGFFFYLFACAARYTRVFEEPLLVGVLTRSRRPCHATTRGQGFCFPGLHPIFAELTKFNNGRRSTRTRAIETVASGTGTTEAGSGTTEAGTGTSASGTGKSEAGTGTLE